jgi:hypothetical protein
LNCFRFEVYLSGFAAKLDYIAFEAYTAKRSGFTIASLSRPTHEATVLCGMD